ncbi:Beta-glucanase [Dactylellina cionopaga]|nr:Beta-glucanase [Dactylellina cionopaga]
MKFRSAVILASAALPAALAQTWTDCNPLKKQCPCNPALGSTYTYDFTKGEGSDLFVADKYFPVKYDKDGVHLPVGKKGDAPTIASTKYILGGRLDCVLKVAPGKGIVSSLVFQSADLDEIDFEWIGSKPLESQSNYFGKGNTETYNRGAVHPNSDATTGFHKFSIDWTQEKIDWYIDDALVRTLTPAQSADLYGSNNYYPQTPMQIKIGSWAAGDPSNAKGVIEWSDGPINYDQGPFEMVIQSLTLTDYSKGATEYCYGDMSGSWASIKVSNDPSKGQVKPETSDKETTTAPSKTTSAAAEKETTSAPKQTTLATSSKEEKTTSSKASSTRRVNTSTYEIAPAITQGMPDSIGNMDIEGPQNKAVSSSATADAQAAAKTSGPAVVTPNSASSMKNAGLGFVVAAFFAAILL